MAVDEDTTDFHVGFFRGWTGWVKGIWRSGQSVYHYFLTRRKVGHTNIIGPFQLHRNCLVARVVRVDPFNDGKSGKILEEDDGGFRR